MDGHTIQQVAKIAHRRFRCHVWRREDQRSGKKPGVTDEEISPEKPSGAS
jgi:hypothetical protein